MQVLAQVLGGEIDYTKIAKITEGASPSDLKASIAALDFILCSAAKHELQQLGLPKEHADSLCRPYQEGKERLRDRLGQTVRRPPLRRCHQRQHSVGP
jgi:hypothetical protein